MEMETGKNRRWDLRSCRNSRSVDWESVTDVSEQTVDTIFKGQAVLEDCLTTEDW
jgi:hypothetical protein